MPISFSQIPADLKIPLYWVEVDPSRAGIPLIHQPALLVGTMTSDGDAQPNVPIAIGTQAQANAHFGIGSEVARMFRTYFANNFANEVWGLGVPEPLGASAAAGAVVITRQQLEAGTIHLYIAGRHVPINIAASDTPQEVAFAIEAAIDEQPDLPVTAKVGTTATASGTGTSSGTNLTISNFTAVLTGASVQPGDTVTGLNTPPGTTIVSQVSGTPGGNGEYTISLDATESLDPLDINLRASGTVDATAGTSITVSGSQAQEASVTQPAGIWPGYSIVGVGVPPNTSILSQSSGTPGADGVYVLSAAVPALTAVPCKFGITCTVNGTSHGRILTVTASTGTIGLGAVVSGTGLTAETVVESQRSDVAKGSGDIAGTVLTVSSVTGAPIGLGARVDGAGVPSGTHITGQVSGTPGGIGDYTLNNGATLTGVSLTFTMAPATPGKDGVYILSKDATAAGVPVDFSATDNAVRFTCTWKGVNGNDIRVDMNYYGSIGGETTPVGLGIQLPATGFLSGGVGVPVFDTAITNLGEKNYEYVAMPYTDSTSLNSWELEYGFEDVGRWGWRRQLYGHIFSARRDTYANLILFGNTRNNGITTVMGVEKTAPSAVFDFTAAYTAKAQRALINDPARPLQTLSLNTVKLAPLHDRFNTIEINALASNGIATQKAGSDNQPMISRETTTYQLNLYGYQDDAYELVTTLATLARLIRNQRYVITSKYPRVKLADDGTRFGPGQAIVTPGIIKGELIAEYVMDMYNGLVENLSAFKNNLIVERDPNDPNRVNVLYGPDLINQLRIFAVLAQFRLQYDRGVDTQIIGSNPGTIGMTGILPSPFNISGVA